MFKGHVVGSWTAFDGGPATGYVLLEAPLSLAAYFDAQSGVGMTGRLIRIPLVNGSVDRMVPAADDIIVASEQWAYKVTYLFDGAANRSFYIFVPSDTVTDIPTAVHQSVSDVPLGSSIFHGALQDLDDDDHPQYFNQVRGDNRYALKGEIPHVGATPPTDLYVGRLWIPT